MYYRFSQVLPEDIFPAVLISLDVDGTHGDEEVEPGHDVPCVLHQLVQVGHLGNVFITKVMLFW